MDSIRDVAGCICPHIRIGLEVSPSQNWDETCPVHGVGTTWFRELPQLPFGYERERHTSREAWLTFIRGTDA